MGWRYLIFIIGGLTLVLWALRFLVFPLYESPRYLIGRGEDASAVHVIHQVAAYNGVSSDLTIEMLTEAGREAASSATQSGKTHLLTEGSSYHLRHIRALFATPRMAFSTGLLMSIWGKPSFSAS
jgi:hypothetical protein